MPRRRRRAGKAACGMRFRNDGAVSARTGGGAEGGAQLANVGIAAIGVEFGRAHQHGAQRLGNALVEKPFLAHARIGRFLHEAEIQDHAESVHVAAHGGLAVAELLGRRIGARSEMARVIGGVVFVKPRDAQIDNGEAVARNHDVARLQIAVDDRRVEAFVQFEHRIAQTGKHIRRKRGGWIAAIHGILQRFAPDVFHHHHVVFAERIAIGYARKKPETPPVALGLVHAPVHRAQTRIALDVFADERPLLGPVAPHEHDALRDFVGRLFQYRIDAIAFFALQGVEMF